jgi:polyisoprenoid-binding protein YceI
MTASATAGVEQQLVGEYVLDTTHSRLGFTARHAMVTRARGQFREFEGRGHLDPDPAQTWAEVRIKSASIDTANDQRDEHLRGPDFLDSAKYPEIVFRSTRIERPTEDVFRVTGGLTIMSTTKLVGVDLHYTGAATDPFGNQRIGFEGCATINRKDWGLRWNVALETGGLLVSECVNIELDISAIKVTQ